MCDKEVMEDPHSGSSDKPIGGIAMAETTPEVPDSRIQENRSLLITDDVPVALTEVEVLCDESNNGIISEEKCDIYDQIETHTDIDHSYTKLLGPELESQEVETCNLITQAGTTTESNFMDRSQSAHDISDRVNSDGVSNDPIGDGVIGQEDLTMSGDLADSGAQTAGKQDPCVSEGRVVTTDNKDTGVDACTSTSVNMSDDVADGSHAVPMATDQASMVTDQVHDMTDQTPMVIVEFKDSCESVSHSELDNPANRFLHQAGKDTENKSFQNCTDLSHHVGTETNTYVIGQVNDGLSRTVIGQNDNVILNADMVVEERDTMMVYRRPELESESECRSSTSVSSDDSEDIAAFSDDDKRANNKRRETYNDDDDDDEGGLDNRKGRRSMAHLIKTKGEMFIDDLPPMEELTITVGDDVNMVQAGCISSIIESLVIVQSAKGIPPLNMDTVLFLDGKIVFGLVFETFGPVAMPLYSVRFNSQEQINQKQITVGVPIFYAPDASEYTHYVFMAHLQSIRGSDASWEHNNEPPQQFLEYSDDEQERQVRKDKENERRRQREGEGTDGNPGLTKRKNRKMRNKSTDNKEAPPATKSSQSIHSYFDTKGNNNPVKVGSSASNSQPKPLQYSPFGNYKNCDTSPGPGWTTSGGVGHDISGQNMDRTGNNQDIWSEKPASYRPNQNSQHRWPSPWSRQDRLPPRHRGPRHGGPPYSCNPPPGMPAYGHAPPSNMPAHGGQPPRNTPPPRGPPPGHFRPPPPGVSPCDPRGPPPPPPRTGMFSPPLTSIPPSNHTPSSQPPSSSTHSAWPPYTASGSGPQPSPWNETRFTSPPPHPPPPGQSAPSRHNFPPPGHMAEPPPPGLNSPSLSLPYQNAPPYMGQGQSSQQQFGGRPQFPHSPALSSQSRWGH